MLISPSSLFITSPTQPRKHARTLPRIALAIAALAAAGLFTAAHATYPGENGVIVFSSMSSTGSKIIKRVSPVNHAVTDLAPGRYPSVSPNGKQVAFVSDLNDVYVMNIDGSNVIQLTNDHVSSFPAWQPDGSKLMYTRIQDPIKPAALWSMNPDGSAKTFVRSLPNTGGVGTVGLAWSPASNSYTFNGGGLNAASDLTSTVIKLAPTGSGSSWAPDGRSILFYNNLGQQFEMNAYGSSQNVPSTGAIYDTGAISPDGTLIAGGVYTNNQSQLTTRARAGTPATFSWPTSALKTDWSRVPQNCFETTSQGGGGILAGDVNFYATECAVVVMPSDRYWHYDLEQVLAIGPDQRLYHRVLKSDYPGFGAIPYWTNFTVVPGVDGNPNGIKVKKIAIAAAQDGTAQAVVIGADDDVVYHATRSDSGRWSTGVWSGFVALDGSGGVPNAKARDVAITISGSTPTSPGNAQVIANDPVAGVLYHRIRFAAGSWSSFQPISDPSFATQSIALSIGEDGNTNVLATVTAPDGSQPRIMQSLRNSAGNWSNWGTVGMPAGTIISASSDVAVTRTLTGTAQVMFTDAAGNAFFQERATPNVPSSWQSQVSSPQIASTVARAVSISAGLRTKWVDEIKTQLVLTRTFPQ